MGPASSQSGKNVLASLLNHNLGIMSNGVGDASKSPKEEF